LNSDKQTLSGQRGNALIYVIIALALLGGLTMLLTKQGNESDDLSYEKTELVVVKTVAFAAAGKNTVDQMLMSGTNINNLSYLRPTMVGFDTAPHHNKIFHPEGGGLTLSANDPNLFNVSSGPVMGEPPPGWFMGRFNNVEWTPTASLDIVLTAYDIQRGPCQAINKKITGSTAIPVLTGASHSYTVSNADGTSVVLPFTKAVCAACDGFPSLCVQGSGPSGKYAYYNIISAQ
jgi:hypothetical protein